MVLLKGLFRKKIVKLFIFIVTLMFMIVILLSSMCNYYQQKNKEYLYDITSFLLFASENHDAMLDNEIGIKSYQRVLNFNIGEVNDIVYNPKTFGIFTDIFEDEVDESKIMWRDFVYNDVIMTYSASSKGTILADDEVVLVLNEQHYNSKYLSNYIDGEIIFKFYDRDISLKIKEIVNTDVYAYIIISDQLFNALLPDEERYIYHIETTNYDSLKKLSSEWKYLEKDSFFSIQTPIYVNRGKSNVSEQNANICFFAYSCSLLLFFLFIFLILKRIFVEEFNNIRLLKSLGFNRKQRVLILLRNMFILDIVVFGFSLLGAGIITFALNHTGGFLFEYLNLECFIYLGVFVLFVEFLFHVLFIRKC